MSTSLRSDKTSLFEVYFPRNQAYREALLAVGCGQEGDRVLARSQEPLVFLRSAMRTPSAGPHRQLRERAGRRLVGDAISSMAFVLLAYHDRGHRPIALAGRKEYMTEAHLFDFVFFSPSHSTPNPH